jgi:hypothetical protein
MMSFAALNPSYGLSPFTDNKIWKNSLIWRIFRRFLSIFSFQINALIETPCSARNRELTRIRSLLNSMESSIISTHNYNARSRRFNGGTRKSSWEGIMPAAKTRRAGPAATREHRCWPRRGGLAESATRPLRAMPDTALRCEVPMPDDKISS